MLSLRIITILALALTCITSCLAVDCIEVSAPSAAKIQSGAPVVFNRKASTESYVVFDNYALKSDLNVDVTALDKLFKRRPAFRYYTAAIHPRHNLTPGKYLLVLQTGSGNDARVLKTFLMQGFGECEFYVNLEHGEVPRPLNYVTIVNA